MCARFFRAGRNELDYFEEEKKRARNVQSTHPNKHTLQPRWMHHKIAGDRLRTRSRHVVNSTASTSWVSFRCASEVRQLHSQGENTKYDWLAGGRGQTSPDSQEEQKPNGG